MTLFAVLKLDSVSQRKSGGARFVEDYGPGVVCVSGGSDVQASEVAGNGGRESLIGSLIGSSMSKESKVDEFAGKGVVGAYELTAGKPHSDLLLEARKKYWRRRVGKKGRKGNMHHDSERSGAKVVTNISGKSRVSLSYLSGGRLGDSKSYGGFDGQEGVMPALPSSHSKPGEEKNRESLGRLSSSAASGSIVQSDCHLLHTVAGLFSLLPRGYGHKSNFSRRLRTPNKYYKGKPMPTKAIRMRASPKPISSLDSCLTAHLLDHLDRNQERSVKRPLDFSSVVKETGKCLGSDGDRSVGRATTGTGHVGQSSEADDLSSRQASLGASPSDAKHGKVSSKENSPQLGYDSDRSVQRLISLFERESKSPAFGADSLPDDSTASKTGALTATYKKRRMSERVPSASSFVDQGGEGCSSKGASLTPMEALLFSFGIGIGVTYANQSRGSEVKQLQHVLKEAERDLQICIATLQEHGLPVPELNWFGEASRSGAYGKAMEEIIEVVDEERRIDDYASPRVLMTEGASSLQSDQIADLEAELEAELDHLTGHFTDLDELELDGVAAVVHGDLNIEGLPAQIDSDGDDKSAPEVACGNNYAVNPRVLTRLLKKLQATRQEERFIELEADLEIVKDQLEKKEKELHLWKYHVRRLNELSLSSPSHGVENTLLGTPSSGIVTPVERACPTSDSEVDFKTEAPKASQHQGTFHIARDEQLSNQAVERKPVNPAAQNGSQKVEPQLARDIKRDPSNEEGPAVDRRLDFGGVRENPWETDELCNELLRSLEDTSGYVPPQCLQPNSDPKPILEESQIEQLLLNSVRNLGSLEAAEISLRSTPSVDDYSSTITTSDVWDNFLESSLEKQFGNDYQNGSEEVNRVETTSYGWQAESSMSVSEQSDGEECHRSGSRPPFTYAVTSSRVQASSDKTVTPFFWNRDGGGLGRAGANTPVDGRVAANQLPSEGHTPVVSSQKEPGSLDKQLDLDPTIYNKIAEWEGLVKREHFSVLSSDWESLSQTSELDQGGGLGTDCIQAYRFEEESNVSDVDECLANMLFCEAVDRSRLESDSSERASRELASIKTSGNRNLDGHVARISPVVWPTRKGRNKEGKVAEEEEYKFLCRTLPKDFESLCLAADKDSGSLSLEEPVLEFQHCSGGSNPNSSVDESKY